MLKKTVSVLLTVVMLISMLPAAVFAADTTLYIGAESFTDKGTFVLANKDQGSFGYILRSPGGGKPENLKNASVTIQVPSAGEYTVWARVRGHAQPRILNIQINGTQLPNDLGHTAERFAWVEAGKITLTAGDAKVEVVDSSANYARIEAVVLTTAAKPGLPEDEVDFRNALSSQGAVVTSEAPVVEEVVVNKHLPEGEAPAKVYTYFFGASSFEKNLGSWLSPGKDGSTLAVLRSPGGQKPENAKSAISAVNVEADGTYYLWTWSRDYADGVRSYKFAVDGKLTQRTLGAHGLNGWAWEYCGKVDLKQGNVQVEVVDSANNYGRFQGAILTNDPTYIPPESTAVEKYLVASPTQTLTSSISGTIEDPNQVEAPEELVNDDYNYIVVTADDIDDSNRGSWKKSTITMGSPFAAIVMSAADGRDHTVEPATFTVTVPKTGIYKVLVRSNDAASNSGRKFKVSVGGTYARECGTHGEGWGFEEVTMPLIAGENKIEIMDHTGNYGRWDMIIITDNLEFVPDNTTNGIKALAAMAKLRPTEVSTEKDTNRPDDAVAVNLNGEYMHFDVSPVLINDRTMVPFRAIFEALGCTVSWDDATETASGNRNGTDIRLRIDSTVAKVGEMKYTLDSPATLVNDRTMVPLRFISEALGAKVSWDDANQTVYISAEIPPQLIMLTAESYYDVGTWHLEGVVTGSFESGVMRGLTPNVDQAGPQDGKPETAVPAKANIAVVRDGTYKVFVHSRDYTTSYTSQRTFAVRIDGTQIGGNMGTHGNNGFAWQDAGTIELKAGEHLFELVDTSGFYARCDMIIITDDMEYKPSSDYAVLTAEASPVRATDVETPEYPLYARENGEILAESTIANDKVQVKFYTVNTSEGPVIQNEIYNNYNGQWIQTNKRSEQLGFMVVRTDEATLGTTSQDRYVYSSSYTNNDKPAAYMGVDLFKAGVPNWFIPTQIESVSENAVKITATTDLGTVSAVWEIADDTDAPKVTVTGTFNETGIYSIGAGEGDELTYEDFHFALAPFRVQSKRVEEGVYNEMYLFAPMGCYTLNANNAYATEKVTKGVVVDPEFTELKIRHRTDAHYGVSMKGADGGYHGMVYAPILGSEEAKLDAGESYTYSYRVISRVADWFDNYKFVAQDLYDVTNYRENTYATLNQAIFNVREFSLDEDQSGWDPLDKGYWNIESKNTTANADPMQAVQTYLLTEDETYLKERTLPGIANFMTRGNLQFNSKGGLDASNGYVSIDKIPYPIGNFINIMNMNVRGGMYRLTAGRTPYLLENGIQNTLAGKNVNGYNSMTPFSDDMYLYQYTGEQKYLDSAMEKADAYLESTVYKDQTEQLNWGEFIYTKYYPNLPALVDLYELSGEQKYLDAAYYTAQYLITTLWVPGVDGEKKNQEITINEGIATNWNGYHAWYGDEQKPIGVDNTTDYTENVEAWTVSPVGIGLEQASTFYGSKGSQFIIMSMWVGDILKIASYTGDDYLANCAENAIVGRFANYSGYYYGGQGFTNRQMQEDYPYVGPEVGGVYYHHIPPFMAMLEDFLISLPMYRSGRKINFPSVRQSGYAYFYANHYGFEAGQVYDMNDMWLWMDEGVLDSGNLQVDWLGARTDGKAAFMLMSQDHDELTTTITLGEKVGAVAETAVLYDAEGNKSTVPVTNGQITVTIPAKGLVTVVVEGEGIKKPAFADFDYDVTGTEVETGSTCYDHGNGKAIVMQFSKDCYYVYVYATDKPADVKEVKLNYSVGGKSQSVSTTDYPYEFIIKVDDASQEFSYSLELTPASGGSAKTVKGGTVKPLD